MANVALSTMWGVERLRTFREFAEKAQAFGTSHVELSSVLPPAWLAELDAGALQGLDVGVSSIHDPCPNAPLEGGRAPSSFQLAALDEDERRIAVSLAKGSIDLSARLGGRAVVLHLGTTVRSTADEARLRQLYVEHGPEASDFLRLREHLMVERRQHRDVALEQARTTLRELAAYATDRGLRLGLENRQDFTELPGIDEMGMLLAEVDPDVVGFWFDVGHAMLMDRLGFVPFADWLTRYGDRTVGTHLHGFLGIQDHHAPGVPGDEVPWDVVARSLPAGALRVMEINQRIDDALVRAAVPFLQQKGIIA